MRLVLQCGLAATLGLVLSATLALTACGKDDPAAASPGDADGAAPTAAVGDGGATAPDAQTAAPHYAGLGSVYASQRIDFGGTYFEVTAEFAEASDAGASEPPDCRVVREGDCFIRSCTVIDGGVTAPPPLRANAGPIHVSGPGLPDGGVSLVPDDRGAYPVYSAAPVASTDGGVMRIATAAGSGGPVFDETMAPPSVAVVIAMAPRVSRDGWMEITWATDGIAKGDRMRVTYDNDDVAMKSRVHHLECDYDATVGRGVVRPALTNEFGYGSGITQVTTVRQTVTITNNWQVTLKVGTPAKGGVLNFWSL